tara:strand:- start:20477 stop:27820 length:7344 start_codon:yes stop_codon:yes gene_type:complete
LREYEEDLNPRQDPGSAIAKSLGQAVATMGLFVGGTILANMGFKRGKSAIFKSMAQHSKGFRDAAKYAQKEGDSLTAFLSRANFQKGSVMDSVGGLADWMHTAANSARYSSIKESWAGMSKIERYRNYRSLGRAGKSAVHSGMAASYAKETAFFFPVIYALDHNIGKFGGGPDTRERPAWYNIPGHAKEMAKFIPMYLAGDAIFRGGSKVVGAGFGMLADSFAKSIPKGVQSGVAETISFFNSGKYLDQEFMGRPIKEWGSELKSSMGAFAHAVGPGRKKLVTATKKTQSGYERTGNSIRNIYKRAVEDFHEKKSHLYKVSLRKYKQRMQRMDKNSDFAVRDNFDDFIHFMGTGSGESLYARIMGTTNYAGSGRSFVHKQFYNESDRMPYMAKLLGLRRARGSDFKDKDTLGSIYDTLKKKHGREGKKKLLKENSKDEFIDNLVSRNMFIHEGSGKLVDLAPMSGKYWSSKMLHSKPLVLGGKFSMADLFPFKVMAADQQAFHRIIPMEEFAAINPANQTQAFKNSPWVTHSGMGGRSKVHPNIYRFNKEVDGLGLLTRKAGDLNYNLFDYQGGAWDQIGRDLKAGLVSDSPKLANVYIQGLIRQHTTPKDRMSTPSDNPIVSFIQRNFSLLDNEGITPSWFGKLRKFMPDNINSLLDSKSSFPYSTGFAKNTLSDLKSWGKGVDDNVLGSKSASHRIANLLARTRTYGNKMSKESFNETLSEDRFMGRVLEFLDNQGVIQKSSQHERFDANAILADDDALIGIASDLFKKSKDSPIKVFGEDKAIDRIIESVKTTGRGLADRGGVETPKQKIKRFIYEYAVHHSNLNRLEENHIVSLLRGDLQQAATEGIVSSKQLAKVDFGMFADKLRYRLSGVVPENLLDPEVGGVFSTEAINRVSKSIGDKHQSFLNLVKTDLLDRTALSGKGSAIDELMAQTNTFDTVYAANSSFVVDDVVRAANQVRDANPFVAYPAALKDQAGLGMGWALRTVNNITSFTGLGWDQAKHPGVGDVAALWGKRLGAFALGSIAYNAADTFTDTSGLFDWTFLDEGITVGVADQMVKARMMAGWAYDKMGIDNAARYMEGLMPGSTKVLPGAAVGYAAGGIKGAILGGLANAYLQPQLAEGPLSFLAALPPLAPFVTDMTKDFKSLQNIYEGTELLPVRKGRGWTLGLTPIAGGRIERYEPGWYPRLKSQFQAGPELYGSKLEQFLAKDIPLVDFSLMDIVDPHYLEKKQYQNRPFHEPSTVFSEVPLVGPTLGATVGRLYNKLHPMAFSGEMHANEARQAYMKGQSFNWKGESLGTYGPQYMGFMGDFSEQGADGKKAVMSQNNLKPLIGEQVYKGWIEPLGLPGFITSAMLWGGDEPFTDIPVAQNANILDSHARTFWDQGFGDLMGTTELYRRAVPRPRTSFESINILQNQMPGWMPENFQQGDPYCLTPETYVETSSGLKRADSISEGDLVRTLQGRYFPVSATKTRKVDEDIYVITINGLEDFPIRVTGGHPFYIDEEWKFAKDLTESDKVTYPLLNIDLPSSVSVLTDGSVAVTASLAYLYGLLSRWSDHSNPTNLRSDIPETTELEIKQYSESLLKNKIDYEMIHHFQRYGPSKHFGDADLPVLLNYLKPFFTVTADKTLEFAVHTKNAAYNIWSLLLQNKIVSKIKCNKIIIEGTYAVEVAFFMGMTLNYRTPASTPCTFDMNKNTTKHGPIVYLDIASITKEKYKGLVYAIDVGEDATFTVPGAAVHNSKIARGELLLPGKSFESFFNPKITFPTGASQLGNTPYEQALHMIGLGDFAMGNNPGTDDILEEGTQIHEMVQSQLVQAGLVSRVEALVADTENNIKGYVDAMYNDPRTGKELPIEIKSIGGVGLYKLNEPKWKHKIQLNTYMAMLGVTSGKLLYVSRDDPSQTKEFTVRFNPNLWESTKGDLAQARMLATEYLEQGYGHAMEGYSYLDRLQVLLNASPYSRKFRETQKLVQHQLDQGYLSPEEEEQFTTLGKQHQSMLRKYQMYPRRFQVSDLLDPDTEYQNLSDNENIQPASDYNIFERIVGSVWETATHLRSPIHTKLIGHYSPEETYENMMVRGDFASWTRPIEGFVKPYGRGLRAADTPLQGAISYGMGGALLGGGIPGAIFGTVFGGVYGSLHGMYRSMTGTNYTPDSFKDRVAMQEYFDKVEYARALQMYKTTGNKEWRREITSNPYGWIETGGGQAFNVPMPSASIGYNSRVANQAYNTIGSPDRGFRSPYGGQDSQRSLDFDPDVNMYSAFSALAPWDRPFWTAFMDTPENKRADVLNVVDKQMGDMLQIYWGKGENVAMPNMGSYFTNNYNPSNLHPLMDPTVNIEDYQVVTAEDNGLNAHDFGLGWRDQMRRIATNPFAIKPVDIEAQGVSPSTIRSNLSQGEIRDTLSKLLERMGYGGATINVRQIPSNSSDTTVVINVKRSSTNDLIDRMGGI